MIRDIKVAAILRIYFLLIPVIIFTQESAAQTGQIFVPIKVNGGADSALRVLHWVDQTVLFPGDTVTYYLEIKSPLNVNILIDDLAPEQLILSNLEVVSSDYVQTTSETDITYRAEYHLTSFDLTNLALLIGEQTIRYYEHESGLQDGEAIPMGEFIVPASQLALRSTIPTDTSELTELKLRDHHATRIVYESSPWVWIVGLGLILISALPVAIWLAPLIRQKIDAVKQQRTPLVENITPVNSRADELETLDKNNISSRRYGYDLLDAILREQLAKLSGVLTTSLTASEIARHQFNLPSDVPSGDVVSVLQDCEQARYGKLEQLPSASQFEKGVTVAQHLLLQSEP